MEDRLLEAASFSVGRYLTGMTRGREGETQPFQTAIHTSELLRKRSKAAQVEMGWDDEGARLRSRDLDACP